MLKIACIYEKTFKVYEENESSFRADLGNNVPKFYDWETANNLVKFLEYFYEMTLRISGSQYVTSNTFFSKIAELFCLLNDLRGVDDIFVRQMGLNMKSKFDKYWGDPTKMNFLIFTSNVLDPQYKCDYLKFSINTIYGDLIGGSLLDNVKSAMFELYND